MVTKMRMANKTMEDLATTMRDSFKATVDHTVGMQERNVQFARGIAEDSVKKFRGQMESNRAMSEEMLQRVEGQRETFQKLAEESINTYMDMVYTPFSYFEKDFEEGLHVVEDEVLDVLPIAGYDDLNVGQVAKAIDSLNAEQIRRVREYEKKNKNRETLIEQFDRKLKPAS